MRRTVGFVSVLATCMAGSLGGCDDGEEDGEDPGEHACEQVDATPVTIDASSMRDATAPLVTISDLPFEATLPEGAPGYVRLEVSEAVEALAFTRDADVIASLYHGETEEGVTSAGPDEYCPTELAEHLHLDLHEPGTYWLELGPTARNRAWLLLMDAEGHAHEH